MNSIAEKYDCLPASQIAETVNDALHKEGGAVTAPPSAGKSTLLSLTILEGLDARSGLSWREGTRS